MHHVVLIATPIPMRVPTLVLSRSKSALFASKFLLPKNSVSIGSVLCPSPQVPVSYGDFPRLWSWFRAYHDGRPRGPLWRGKKLLGKEALFVILGLKRFKDDNEKVDKFIKTHVLRLLKMDMIAVLTELERQEEVHLAVKMFKVIKKQDWYKPDLHKDLIVALARSKNMDVVMELWESMKKENLFPDSQTYTEVIRGFL